MKDSKDGFGGEGEIFGFSERSDPIKKKEIHIAWP